ncbi:beta-N-acetylglucosaminidase domain-containing protein [Mycoplasmopsis alligatoris]|uniref:F5/8 type C domain protein n=1 Tax=Mycoplasmopsis alligatoris A21JP2 TaxID=747682 RepID=D4XVZ5_9BACT|nr:beta-N-acetylglucosaminidase domain-containing protein [Mycoplasmopsis alligatoris]EFF41483.1 F5/8 type C domain protein [Mycoplasmopsis alligatoris A21JP2]
MKIKSLKTLSLCTLSISPLILLSSAISTGVNNKDEQDANYQLYPKPHKITYQKHKTILRTNYNLVSDSLDKAANLKLEKIFKLKNMNKETDLTKDHTTIKIVNYSKDSELKKQVLSQYKDKIELKNFDKKDSYSLIISNNEIIIIAKHDDAIYFALSSLYLILEQINGLEVQNFTITDYADLKFRGFIEGFYGIPWTYEDRKSLMRYGSNFKMNNYTFAPKDDPYHQNKWFEKYPEDELSKIKELVEVGKETKVEFVWTIHPFMSKIKKYGANPNTIDKDWSDIHAKFEQLYSIGVRQFGVLADDVGAIPRQTIIELMNKLVDWGKSKGDVKDWFFCPVGYNTGWLHNSTEIYDYDKGFKPEVQIFWTGNKVLGAINDDTLKKFRTINNPKDAPKRRPSLFWLNWPVNGQNTKRMIIGKAELLKTDIDPEDSVGVLTNPMPDAEPSKVALYAVADYTWNVKDFDAEKSWKSGFKYLDKETGPSLLTMAWHMSDNWPNGASSTYDESINIKDNLDNLTKNINLNSALNKVDKEKVTNEMDNIISSAADILSNLKNKVLYEQMKPFVMSLRDRAISLKNFILAYELAKNDEKVLGYKYFSEGVKYALRARTYKNIIINGLNESEAGYKRIRPFMENLQVKTSVLFNDFIFNSSIKTTDKATYSTNINMSKMRGSLNNLADNNTKSGVLLETNPKKDDYFKVEYDYPKTIYGIHIKQTWPSNTKDYFNEYKVQYTSDNQKWTDIENNNKTNTTAEFVKNDLKIENVKAIRIINTKNQPGTWIALENFSIDLIKPIKTNNKVEVEKVNVPGSWSYHQGNEKAIFDNNPSTYAWFKMPNDTHKENDFISLKFKKPIELGIIKILFGRNNDDKDKFNNFDLEYSTESTPSEWKKLQTFSNTNSVTYNAKDKKIKNVTYLRIKSNNTSKGWVALREFSVSDFEIIPNTMVLNNKKDNDFALYANYERNKGLYTVEPTKNISLKKDEFLKLDLLRNSQIQNMFLNLSNEAKNKLTFEYSSNDFLYNSLKLSELEKNTLDFNARYIKLANKSDQEVKFDINKLQVISKEYTAPKLIFSNMGSQVSSNELKNIINNDPILAAKFSNSQTKGQYLIIDIGQEIMLKNLKLVSKDSHFDYLRDAEILISKTNSSKESDWEKVITIGDGIPNKQNDDDINSSLTTHLAPFNLIANPNINKKARYIKVRITADYKWKQTEIGEVTWNYDPNKTDFVSEYFTYINNKNYVSDSNDTNNNFYEYMNDNNLNTSFVSKNNNGKLNFILDSKQQLDAKGIKIVLKEHNDAKLSIKTYDETTKKIEIIELGKLYFDLSDFAVPKNKKLLELIFEWKNEPLLINEVILSKNANVISDDQIKVLDQNLSKIKNSGTLNQHKETYDLLLNILNLIKTKKYYGLDLYNRLKATSEHILNNKTNDKNDSQELNKLLNESNLLLKNKADYTLISFLNLEKTVKNIEQILINKNIFNDDLTKLYDQLLKAKNDLAFDLTNQDLAKLKLIDFKKEIELNKYSPETLNKLKILYDQLEKNTISKEKIAPSVYTKLFEEINNIVLPVNKENKILDEISKNINVKFFKDKNLDSTELKLENATKENIILNNINLEKYDYKILNITKDNENNKLKIEYELFEKEKPENKITKFLEVNNFLEDSNGFWTKKTIILISSIASVLIALLIVLSLFLIYKAKRKN